MTRSVRTQHTQPARAAHHPYSVKLLKLLLGVICACLLWGVLSWLISAVPLRRVQVEGLTRYSQEEVLVSAGLSTCRHLSEVDRAEIRQSLTSFYPYIASVRVRYVFPFGIRLDIVEESPQYYTCIAEDYFALSADLKILERATSDRRFREAGLRKITLTGIRSAMVGQVLTYDGDYLTQVLQEIDESELGARVTDVQLGDRYHLSVICDGGTTLFLGDITAIDTKLQIALHMLDDAVVPEGYCAMLDVSDIKKTSIRYLALHDGVLSSET